MAPSRRARDAESCAEQSQLLIAHRNGAGEPFWYRGSELSSYELLTDGSFPSIDIHRHPSTSIEVNRSDAEISVMLFSQAPFQTLYFDRLALK